MQVLRNAYNHRKDRINQVFGSFLSQSLFFALLLAAIKAGEYYFLTAEHSIAGVNATLLSHAIQRNFVWWIYLVSAWLVPYLVFSFVSIKLARWSFAILILFACLLEFGLMRYFISTLNLLGADLFTYSASELMLILNASGAITFWSTTSLVLGGALLLLALRFVPATKLPIALQFIGLLILFVVGFFRFDIVSENEGYASVGAWQFDNNKTLYFLDNSLQISNRTLPNYQELYFAGNSIYDGMDYQKTWDFSHEFPFYRDSSLNYGLSPYFKSSNKAPNIVFVIVESLGAAYSGTNANLGSFTPFIDSLAKAGLNFENALSSTGRTFGVLSGVTGSLPFGKNGFLELRENTPKYKTLFTELQPLGYSSGFYYGSDATFDNMESYLLANSFSTIIDKDDYPTNYQQLPSSASGSSWGYGDFEMFKHGIDLLPPSPHVSAFLTVASHSPFEVQNQEEYEAKATAIIDQNRRALNFDLSKYKKQLATIVYADDAVKQFITDYQKQKDFDNTIFIITGDHRMPEIPLSNKLDRFHVPLVIYSRLLNQAATFKSVVSHLDIVPSLLALLKQNFNQAVDEGGAWVGTGLGTSSTFEAAKCIPLMRNKNEFGDFVWGQYYLNDNNVAKITPQMNLIPVADRNLEVRLLNEMNNFKDAQQQALYSNKLVPN